MERRRRIFTGKGWLRGQVEGGSREWLGRRGQQDWGKVWLSSEDLVSGRWYSTLVHIRITGGAFKNYQRLWEWVHPGSMCLLNRGHKSGHPLRALQETGRSQLPLLPAAGMHWDFSVLMGRPPCSIMMGRPPCSISSEPLARMN